MGLTERGLAQPGHLREPGRQDQGTECEPVAGREPDRNRAARPHPGQHRAGITSGRHRQERGEEVDDIAEAVAERIGRQGYLLQRDRQFVFVIEEPVLRFRPCGTAVQRDQFKHLLEMMMLPSVSFGVIPMGTGRRGHRPRESFDITDSDLVTIELLSGFLSLTHPDEIGAYVTAWEHLFSIAVRGKAARALVKDAMAALMRAMGTGDAHR